MNSKQAGWESFGTVKRIKMAYTGVSPNGLKFSDSMPK